MNLSSFPPPAVFPICAPCILNGGIFVITGDFISALGPADDIPPHLRQRAREENFPNCILMPGLINAHTHLELSFLRNQFQPMNFIDWVIQLIKNTPQDPTTLSDLIPTAVRYGMNESLRFGVTTVGDITRHTQLSRAILRDGPLRAVSFGEILALGSRRNLLTERLAAACDASQVSDTLSIGLSPHAPYTVEGPALQQIVQAAARDNLPLCIHLAELQDEQEFLATLGGSLRRIWETIGNASELLDPLIPLFDGGPIRWAQHWGLLKDAQDDRCHASAAHFAAEACGTASNADTTPDNHMLLTGPPPRQKHGTKPPLFAHVNYATDAELEILSQCRASVAYCPRTRQFFGHDRVTPHCWQEMLARGINVCLATDSLASNPDLSVLREAQTLLKLFPDTPPESILPLITGNAAKALHLDHQLGTLEPGKIADLAALPLAPPFPTTTTEIARTLIATAPVPSAVWIAGKNCPI